MAQLPNLSIVAKPFKAMGRPLRLNEFDGLAFHPLDLRGPHC